MFGTGSSGSSGNNNNSSSSSSSGSELYWSSVLYSSDTKSNRGDIKTKKQKHVSRTGRVGQVEVEACANVVLTPILNDLIDGLVQSNVADSHYRNVVASSILNGCLQCALTPGIYHVATSHLLYDCRVQRVLQLTEPQPQPEALPQAGLDGFDGFIESIVGEPGLNDCLSGLPPVHCSSLLRSIQHQPQGTLATTTSTLVDHSDSTTTNTNIHTYTHTNPQLFVLELESERDRVLQLQWTGLLCTCRGMLLALESR